MRKHKIDRSLNGQSKKSLVRCSLGYQKCH